MDELIFPQKITVALIDKDGKALALPNVLLSVHLFARRKNDFILQPFVTDAHGVATITRDELLAEVEAHYDSGLMDHCAIEECAPSVEIATLRMDEIKKAIVARRTAWKMLLKGESRRWGSMEELITVYRSARNLEFCSTPLRVLWNGEDTEAAYSLHTRYDGAECTHLQHEEWDRNRNKPTPELLARTLAILDRAGSETVEPGDELPEGYLRKK